MMSSEIAESLASGIIVANRFKVVRKLGEGGCGSVYKVEDLEQKNTFHAMKVEFNSNSNGSVLKMEILTLLRSKKHVAKLIASGKKPTYTYMVMTLLGESLCSLVKKYGPIINVSTQTRIGICLLFGQKQIHDIGYIHRDLKPANIALGYKGTSEERFFMVLDFGLARQFVCETDGKWVMRRPRERALFRGTARYCSLAMHDRLEQGRVDDLWATLYILAELRCKLPWADLCEKNEIADMKRQTTDEVLLSKSPVQLLEFARYVRGLNYYDRPEYETIYRIFESIMKHGGYKWSDPYHWESRFGYDKSISRNKNSLKRNNKADKSPTVSTKTVPTAVPDVPLFQEADFLSNPIGF
ncbi:unnamed protein product [Caenorhabditis bovis]|uniref:Protein kinase domain-containing protein n=1 Tax=Caenorhabditis bovis TaxID=2654633 RepID=A0A8S1F793_9PELO|nr:unnamed protein product [Caenorhabditis bovis]